MPRLRTLNCSGNQLTKLDLSNVPALHSITCLNTELTVLDVSSCPDLDTVICDQEVKIIEAPEQIVIVRRI